MFEGISQSVPLAFRKDAMNNGSREELITLTQNPKSKPENRDEDSIDKENATHDHDDTVVDEQGEESFPASDPPANY